MLLIGEKFGTKLSHRKRLVFYGLFTIRQLQSIIGGYR